MTASGAAVTAELEVRAGRAGSAQAGSSGSRVSDAEFMQ